MEKLVLDGFEDAVLSFVIYERDDFIELSMLSIKPEFRGQGIGMAIMRKVCSYADSEMKDILLTPEAPEKEESISQSRLINFYEGFGFVPNKGKIRNYDQPSHTYKRISR